MPDDVIARAEQAMDGVTEGPWEVRDSDGWISRADSINPIVHAWQEGECEDCETPHDGPVELLVRPSDATFIAVARSLVPELVAALREERAERDEARAAIARVRAVIDGKTWEDPGGFGEYIFVDDLRAAVAGEP